MAESKALFASRRKAYEAYFADGGQPAEDIAGQAPSVPRRSVHQVASFLGVDEGVHRRNQLSSFTMYKGDFRSELCSDGEAMRIDPEGKPYLVDTQARHDAQLDFALLIAMTIFAKSREAEGSEVSAEAPAESAEPKAKPKAKPKAR
ncbi:unnamed protein product [Cladocopium goreaui]|uniref:LINE-1 retrotransposable element ORF2 protein n=1 Tax=Cladocopium goreaui TaxID=2562237 RepID=A0A9P1GJ59_9DINO|nr:unnamed protein product [Cladocopium goreaui]